MRSVQQPIRATLVGRRQKLSVLCVTIGLCVCAAIGGVIYRPLDFPLLSEISKV